MNSYEAKRERRREQLEARADRLQREGSAKVESGMGRLRAIPFGQPILVGHHSEKRDRNYRRKARDSVTKGFALQEEARDAARRAEAVGTGGISSDDPAAVVKLKEELAKHEANQVKMAAANKLVRKHKAAPEGALAGLAELGFPETIARKLFEPDFCGRIGFPGYMLTNNGANIRRIKARIEEISRNANRETKEQEIEGGIRVVENAEENRVQIFFPGKPAEAVRAVLKSYGFRWSPYAGAWQRHLNSSGIWAAKWALEKIAATKGDS